MQVECAFLEEGPLRAGQWASRAAALFPEQREPSVSTEALGRLQIVQQSTRALSARSEVVADRSLSSQNPSSLSTATFLAPHLYPNMSAMEVDVAPAAPLKRTRGESLMDAFAEYRLELDTHYDRRERIVKQSRDITAQSKKLIFSAHR